MPLWKCNQRAFNGGQLDARLMGRTDLAKYYQGASELTNFLVKRQGCITKRRGTRMVAVVGKLGSGNYNAYRLIPFAYNRDEGYVIVLLYHESNGCSAVIYGKNGVKKATLTNLPYLAAEFNDIECCQSGYTLFMAHKSHPFARLIRKGETNWVYEAVDFLTLGGFDIPPAPIITSTNTRDFKGEGASRTVEYCATAVKDDVEGYPSEPVSASYQSPWTSGATIAVGVAKATGSENPDYFNFYKRVDGTWGFIGTSSELRKEVTTLPKVTRGVKGTVRNNSSTTTATSSGLLKKKAQSDGGYSGYGYVIDGTLTLTFADPQYVDEMTMSLGKALFHHVGPDPNDNSKVIYYLEFIRNMAQYIEVTFTMKDGSTIVKTSTAEVASEAIRDSSIRGYNSDSLKSKAQEKAIEMTPNGNTTTFAVYSRNTDESSKKMVSSITIKGYVSNGGALATGSVGQLGYSTTYSWSKNTGTPFVISGIWFSRYGGDGSKGFEDDYITPDASHTPPNIEDKFNRTGEYPGTVALYLQRLALAASDDKPFSLWLSGIGDLYNFNTHDSLREDDAIELTLPATKYPNINHMVLNRDLILFCDSGEWIVYPVSGNSLSYKTISTKIQSQIGCSKEFQPIVIGDDVIFVNMTNETIHAIKYSYASDGYEATDVSILSQDMFRNNSITSIAYKQYPDSIVTVTLADGTLATLSYMKEHEVIAWSHHKLGGGMKALYCCADGSVEGGTTDLYILALNEVSGNMEILRVNPDLPLVNIADSVSLDRIVEETAATSAALPARMMAVDKQSGEVIPVGGTMKAGRTYLRGYPFEAKMVTVRPEPSANETIQFEIKNATEAEVRVQAGTGFKVGQYAVAEAKDCEVKLEPTFDGAGGITLADADKTALLTGSNNRDGRVRVTQTNPWPLTILSLSTTYQIEPANAEPRGGGNGD